MGIKVNHESLSPVLKDILLSTTVQTKGYNFNSDPDMLMITFKNSRYPVSFRRFKSDVPSNIKFKIKEKLVN